MANVEEKFGLRPYRKLDGTPLAGAQNRYTIASGYSDAIFQGEMVEPLGTGNIQRHGPNTSDAVIGELQATQLIEAPEGSAFGDSEVTISAGQTNELERLAAAERGDILE